MEEVAFPKPLVHLFVCINNRTIVSGNEKSSCGPGIDEEVAKRTKQWVLSHGLATKVYVTKTHCLGFCHKEGGVAVVYPSGRFFKEIQGEEDLKEIIKSELNSLSIAHKDQ